MKKEIFLIPYAHLDTQWRWEYPTTIRKYLKNTLVDNIRLFETYSGHQFNFTGAIRYSMMKEYYPDLFSQIRTYIDEGRWHPAGTCMDETDALIPCVESMIRNILYGDRWAQRELGRSSRDYMIPDCFGFPGNMPTVLTHCGIQGFSTQKLSWHSSVGIPFDIGIWKGKDGSELVSALNPGAYITHIRKPVHRNRHCIKKLKSAGQKNGIWKSFQYYGVGDIGGAPKEGSVKNVLAGIEKSGNAQTELSIRQGSPEQFFSMLTSEEKEKMDRFEGDMLLTLHSAGTLSSAAVMKRWNRKNEQLAFAAEAAAVTALIHGGCEYPSQKIYKAWTCVLGSQMHDILPGTSTPNAYCYAQNDEILALNLWTSILEDSAAAIVPHLKGDGDLLLYNPCELHRKDPVRVDLGKDQSDQFSADCLLTDPQGREFAGQVTPDYRGNKVLTFIPELDPFSWTVFKIHEDRTSVNTPVSLKRDRNSYTLENAAYRIVVEDDGCIRSVFQKSLEKELLSRPMAYEFQKEVPGIFPAWNMDWKDRQKAPFARIEKGGRVSISEEGPQRCSLSVIIEYGQSVFTKEIALSGGSEIVEFTEKIHWRESGCSLKLALTGDMKQSTFTTNWETSREKRDVNHKKLYEMPSRYWADLSCDEDWGFSILEDSKYGYDHPAADTLRMTLLYTPGLKPTDPFRDQSSQDWGDHTIRYALYGHRADWKNTDIRARRFNQPVRPFLLTRQGRVKNQLMKKGSFITVESDSIAVLALKKAEDSNSIVIRLCERRCEAAAGDLVFNAALSRVQRINGLEEILEEIEFSEYSFTASLTPDSIASYLVEFATPPDLTALKQQALDLPYNGSMVYRGAATPGLLFPDSQIPTELNGGIIKYRFLEGEGEDSLCCRGQRINVPPNFNTLSVLCASEKEMSIPLRWLDAQGDILKTEDLFIPSMYDFIGQWDQRIWNKVPRHESRLKRDYLWLNKCTGIKEGYVKRDRVEWFTSHTIENGEPRPYKFGYMFTKTLSLPDHAAALQLPDTPEVKIFAVTASFREITVVSAACLTDKYDF